MIHISHEHLKANVGFTLVFIRQTALHLKRKERERDRRGSCVASISISRHGLVYVSQKCHNSSWINLITKDVLREETD